MQFREYRVDNSMILGVGGFAKVKLATHRRTGHQVAVKIIRRQALKDGGDEEKLHREVKHQNLLRHQNIVRLHTWLTTRNHYLLACNFLLHLVVKFYSHIESHWNAIVNKLRTQTPLVLFGYSN